MFITKIKRLALVTGFLAVVVLFATSAVISAKDTKQIVPIISQSVESREQREYQYMDNSDTVLYSSITTDQQYTYPSDDMSIVFTSLDENTDSPFLAMEKTLVELDGQYYFGYEFNTNMENGQFSYDLTLPNEYEATDVDIKYSEDGGNTFVDVSNKIIGSKYVYLKNMDHFTIFVVVGTIDSSNNIILFDEKTSSIIINEVYFAGNSDWAELYNKAKTNASLSNHWLCLDDTPAADWIEQDCIDLEKYAGDIELAPGDYMTVDLGDMLSNSGNLLLYWDVSDMIPSEKNTLEIDRVAWKDAVSISGADDTGVAEVGRSIGRIPDGVQSSQWFKLDSSKSKGLTNEFAILFVLESSDLVTKSNTLPEISGTVNKTAGVTIVVTVDIDENGVVDASDWSYTTSINGDGTWAVQAQIAPNGVLEDGVYDVFVVADDGMGNLSEKQIELIIDTTSSVVTILEQWTNDTTPTVEGCLNEENGSIISVAVNGVEYIGDVVYGSYNDGCKDWTLSDNIINPSLADGSYDVSVYSTDSVGNNSGEQIFEDVLIVDTVAPVIVLNEPAYNNIVVEINTGYVEEGASWTDDIDGSGDIVSGTIKPTKKQAEWDSNTIQKYTFYYSYKDKAGNSATVQRNVEIVEDTTKPTITLLGDNPQVIEFGNAYTELGATADDNYDGDITDQVVIDITALDMDIVGQYTVTYDVTDSNSNVADQVTRTVKVVDTQIPVTILDGDSLVVLEYGEEWTEIGYSASDNYDGDITASVIVSGSVNDSLIGEYILKYNVSDSSSNAAVEKTRTVKIVDTQAPVIYLEGDSILTVEYDSVYVDVGATAVDNYDGDITDRIVALNQVDTSVLGTYYVKYNISDTSGNDAEEVIRIVKVKDTTKPVIVLIGDNPQIIELGDNYVELNAEVTDNYDDSLSVVIDSSTVNTNVVAEYFVTYNATDSNGNIAIEIVRTVKVKDTTSPVMQIVKDVDAGPTQVDKVSAKATDLDMKDLEYKLISDKNECSDVEIGDGVGYTSEEVITFSNEDNNDMYLCFVAKDKSGNIERIVTTNKLNIDITPPVLIMRDLTRNEFNASDLTYVDFIVEQESGIAPQCELPDFDSIQVDQPKTEQAYTVTCSLTDTALNITEAESTFTLNNNEPTAYIMANPGLEIVEYQSLVLTASIVGGNQSYSYLWSGNCSGSAGAVSFSSTVGSYACGLTVTDSDGDMSYASVAITVVADDEEESPEEDPDPSQEVVVTNYEECVINDGLISPNDPNVCIYDEISYTRSTEEDEKSSEEAVVTTYSECVQAGGTINSTYGNICEINNEQFVDSRPSSDSSDDAGVLGATEKVAEKDFPYWALAALGAALVLLIGVVAVKQHKKDKVTWY